MLIPQGPTRSTCYGTSVAYKLLKAISRYSITLEMSRLTQVKMLIASPFECNYLYRLHTLYTLSQKRRYCTVTRIRNSALGNYKVVNGRPAQRLKYLCSHARNFAKC